jgi:hypothetical protein
MIYAPNGQPANTMRVGRTVDGFQLPNGTIISVSKSLELHNKIKNDARFRERIEQADRESAALKKRLGLSDGRIEESEHLAMLRTNNTAKTAEVEKKIINNQAFGEKVLRKRIENEPEMKGSAEGYEKLNS